MGDGHATNRLKTVQSVFAALGLWYWTYFQTFPDMHTEIPKILQRLLRQHQQHLCDMRPVLWAEQAQCTEEEAAAIAKQERVLELRPIVTSSILMKATIHSNRVGKLTQSS